MSSAEATLKDRVSELVDIQKRVVRLDRQLQLNRHHRVLLLDELYGQVSGAYLGDLMGWSRYEVYRQVKRHRKSVVDGTCSYGCEEVTDVED